MVEIRQLVIEKLSVGDLTENVLPVEGLEPGFWYSIWGKRDNCFPVLKQETNSPEGKILQFAALKKEDGKIVTMPLPFLSGRKFELSFWIRGKEKFVGMAQVTKTTCRTHFAVGKEWKEIKLSGMTPEKLPDRDPQLMLFDWTRPLPAFEIGGVNFRYLP